MIDVESNYKIYDAAIIEIFRYWHHYLDQPYSNMRLFMTTHTLTRRQVQLALNLFAFEF